MIWIRPLRIAFKKRIDQSLIAKRLAISFGKLRLATQTVSFYLGILLWGDIVFYDLAQRNLGVGKQVLDFLGNILALEIGQKRSLKDLLKLILVAVEQPTPPFGAPVYRIWRLDLGYQNTIK